MTASRKFIEAILHKKRLDGERKDTSWESRLSNEGSRPEKSAFADHPILAKVRMLRAVAERFGIGDPFFKVHEGTGGAHTRIAGKDYLNFSHYNYLGLNGHPEVNAAAQAAIELYGTSAGASRLVAGERPVQRELELALAENYQVEDSVVFVSGHATNISAIATLFGPGDVVFHDSLIHNSVLEGIKSSGAVRRPFPHNDLPELERMLGESRKQYAKALIVVEGLYSMDGDVADLPRLLEIKHKNKALLMVDEAHSLGVLGPHGRGLAEHYGINPRDVDIWMGTLSKSLAACGGYIAGSYDLVEILKSQAPGFVYSVGISPPLAAAALTALKIMRREPERVEKLWENSALFLDLARASALNTGFSCGKSIIPVITGSSRKAITLSNRLFEHGVNVQPIIHPAVEEKASRLRFFITAAHTTAEIRMCCEITEKLIHAKGM